MNPRNLSAMGAALALLLSLFVPGAHANGSPFIVAPSNNSVLGGMVPPNQATFVWDDSGVMVEDHAVWFGSSPGGRQYGYAWAKEENPNDPASVTELTFSKLPVNGEPVYVTFYWMVDGVWNKSAYEYTAANVPDPELTSPTDGAVMTGTSATFTWDTHGLPSRDVAVWVGSRAGGREYGYVWAKEENPGDPGSVTSLAFTKLPFLGETVHVTFYWLGESGAWKTRPYTYTAADLRPATLQGRIDALGGGLAGLTCAAEGDIAVFSGGQWVCESDLPAPARFVDNGDGTVTDNQTGLMWEQKDDCAIETLSNPHCYRNAYEWSSIGGEPDGTLFTDFLASLRLGISTYQSQSVTKRQGYTDWRIPTSQELRTILDPACANGMCIDEAVFGPSVQASNLSWWTSSANDASVTFRYRPYIVQPVPGEGKINADQFPGDQSGRYAYSVIAVRGVRQD